MEKEYLISVIVPVYNAKQYLGECLDSILNQTFSSLEIVIIDDGSTDGSSELIDSYAAGRDNFTVVHQENKGIKYARVAGLQNAHGKYIAWVDADDFIKPDMMEKLYNLITENDADYAYCNYSFYPHKVSRKQKWFREYTGEIDYRFIERNTQLWNKLTKRELLDQIKFTEIYPQISEYANIAILLNAERIAYTTEELYCYRVGQDSLSGGGYEGRLNHYLSGAQLTKKLKPLLIEGTKYEETLGDYFDYRYIYTLILIELVAAYNQNKKVYTEARKKLKALHFRKNPYTRLIIGENYGKLKSFVFRYLMQISYLTSVIITKTAM